MHSKRVLKLIICLIISISIIIQCSFSCFAARAIFTVDSKDWISSSSDMYSAKYPDKGVFQLSDVVYQHSELNDSYYVMSNFWEDYNLIKELDITFPELPVEDSFPHNYGSAVFRYFDSYVLVTGYDPFSAILTYDYSTDGFYFYPTSSFTSHYYLYALQYPYTTWIPFAEPIGTIPDFRSNPVALFPTLNGYQFEYGTDPFVWTSHYIGETFTPEDTVVYPASDFDITEKSFSHVFEFPLSVTSGVLYFQIPQSVISKLSNSDAVFQLEDFGYIIGTPTEFVHFRYDMTVRVDGNYFGSTRFLEYNWDGIFSGQFLDVGDAYISDYSDPVDLSETDLTGLPVDIIVTYNFVSSGYNLFFPGSFSIINYSDYIDNSQHQEVLDKVDSAAGQITTSIGNAVTNISTSITDSTTAITDSLDSMNSNLEYIISGDIDLSQPDIPNSDLDSIVAEQDKIVGDILSSLNDDISDFVPAGYDSYSDYLIDNINSFKSEEYNNAFTFIRSSFDNIIASFSIMPLLLFSLTFGFAVFALGRRLS